MSATSPSSSRDPQSQTGAVIGGSPAGPATVAVQHHIYSSAGGYRTLFAHPAAKAHLPVLEEWARSQCSSPQTQTLWASLPLNATHWLISKTFNAGVDRAGRPRKCVHTIIVERARLAERWPSFNPMRLPTSWFLSKKANLDTISLSKLVATSLAPPAAHPRLQPNPIGSERDLALVRVLMHGERGLVLCAPETTERIVAIMDWLPLAYRLRWGVATLPLPATQPAHTRQVILDGALPLPRDGALPLLAHGNPLQVQRVNYGLAGVWDIWLGHLEGTTSKTFETFRAWFDRLPLHSAPTAAEEHWLLAAFQCLAPFEPVAAVAPKLQAGHMGQIALGILALGWADQPGAAVDRLAEYGDALIAAGNVPALVQLLGAVQSATAPSLAAADVDVDVDVDAAADGDAAGSQVVSLQAQLAEDERLYAPHAVVAQTVMRLLLTSSRVSLTPAIAADVPTPDVRATAAPWLGQRRSLLWANLFVLLRDLLAQAESEAGAAWLADTANRASWIQVAGLLSAFRHFEVAFARDHHWILNELAAPTGLPRRLGTLYDRLVRKHGAAEAELAPARRQLAPFGVP